jgi:type IV secretion system protein TrbI
MATSDPAPYSAPPVRDNSTKPPGILPRGTQARVIGGIALVMVIVIAFAGRNAPKDQVSSAAPGSAVLDPSEARIREYRARIDEQAKKLAIEQAQWAQARQGLESSNTGAALAPGPALGPSGLSPYAASRNVDPIQSEKRKREYDSLFASNIALSYRTEGQPTAPGTPFVPKPEGIPDALTAANRYAAALLAAQTSWPPSASAASTEAPDARAAIGPAQQTDRANTGEGTRPEERTTRAGNGKSSADLNRADGKEYRLFEGTVLETVLTNRLDGSFSGPVNCMVTTHVYSQDRQHVLIPQGSRVLGEVRKVETFGDQRLAVWFHRLIMPDGYSLNLDTFQGLNQIGETGLVDQVNRHYLQVFGVSLAIGAIAGLSQSNTHYGVDASATDAYRQGVASNLSQSSLRILDRYLNVLPAFTIREGHRVKVYLTGDLSLPAYDKHRMPSDL